MQRPFASKSDSFLLSFVSHQGLEVTGRSHLSRAVPCPTAATIRAVLCHSQVGITEGLWTRNAGLSFFVWMWSRTNVLLLSFFCGLEEFCSRWVFTVCDRIAHLYKPLEEKNTWTDLVWSMSFSQEAPGPTALEARMSMCHWQKWVGFCLISTAGINIHEMDWRSLLKLQIMEQNRLKVAMGKTFPLASSHQPVTSSWLFKCEALLLPRRWSSSAGLIQRPSAAFGWFTWEVGALNGSAPQKKVNTKEALTWFGRYRLKRIFNFPCFFSRWKLGEPWLAEVWFSAHEEQGP